MKSLTTLLEERIFDKDNIFIWNYVELDKWDDNIVFNKLKEHLLKFKEECIVTLLSTYDDEINNKYPSKLRNAAISASEEYKSFAKLSDEKKEQWINKKIEEIKRNESYRTSWPQLVKNTKKVPLIIPPEKVTRETIQFDNFTINVKNDIYQQNTSQDIQWDSSNFDKCVERVFEAFPLLNDDFKKHFKGFAIYTRQKEIKKFDRIYITFMFDDEFENSLDKSQQNFYDFMHNEYKQGRYMGD